MKRIVFLIIGLTLTIGGQAFAQKKQTSDYNFQKAIELADKGDEVEAMKYVSEQISQTPEFSDAYVLRAQLYYRQEKIGNALSDINKAIKFADRKTDEVYMYSKYWWRAIFYDALEEDDKALSDFNMAYKLAMKEDKSVISDILEQRAQFYFDAEDYASAEKDYREMLKYDETNQLAMMGLVRNRIAEEKYEEAVEIADKCEKYDDSYNEIYRFRMQAYDAMGETDKAIDDAISYVEYSEDSETSLIEPVLKKHLSYALAKVNEKIAANDDNYGWKMLRTSIYEYAYDYPAAIREYDAIEKEYGASASICYYRSLCYNEAGYTDKAVKDITRSIELSGDEDNTVSLLVRAGYYRDGGMYQEAIADVSEAIERYPTYGYSYYLRGWCYELSGDDEKAMADYNAGIDIDKTYPYIYLMRGEQYLKYGDRDRANADFEEVVCRDTVAESGSARQYALHFLGRDDEAVEWMEKMIEDDPEYSGAYYDKACLLARMERVPEALEALRTAFEKGFRSFAHIEHDDDMDILRNEPEFVSLIQEYKAEMAAEMSEMLPDGQEDDKQAAVSEIQMTKMYSGVYEVPCDINGLPLKFIFDTGASIVSISSVEASFMLKNDYLKKEDIRGKDYFSTATGEIREGTVINLREIKVGDAILRNVEASVAHNQQAPLLLGQSVLERFGTITIDNINSKLIIAQ